jgi:HK97 family phage prohead protease
MSALATEIPIPTPLLGEQHREATIEHLDLDEGTILMRAAPYDVECMLDHELFESFAPKTFERASNAPTRCKLWHLHDGPLVGHATEVEDRPDGLWIRSRFSKTPNAQEARELAADGTLDQCSITFRPMRDWMKVERRSDGLHIRHSRAGLLGVALVAHGAYAQDAFIASVRDASADRAREAAIARLRAMTH